VQKYRPLTSSANTINVNDTDVASLIEQKIAQTALPQVRIDSLVVNPRQSTALWDNVLDLEFGDRISVKIVNPDNSSYTEELWIESISHRINASTQSWLYTITLSPATSSAWILGQAQLGLGTRFAYT
jgi:predicted secreted protein